MTDEQRQILDVYLLEYEKLKDEQTERIGFRDNLLYFTLGIYGAVLALALGEQESPYALYALLVLPWVSLILGWTYLINDQKITAIGRYIRYNLAKKISKLTGKPEGIEAVESILGWETAHRSDKRHKRRKYEQLIIDEIAFVISGIVALGAFAYQMLSANQSPGGSDVLRTFAQVLAGIELVFLVALGIEIFLYADLAKGR